MNIAVTSPAVSQTDDMALIYSALNALLKGDATVRLPSGASGLCGEAADAFNDLVAESASMAEELAGLSQTVGKEGKLKKRASLHHARGFWAGSIDSVNSLIEDLVQPTSEAARVIGAVAQGDLSKSMALEVDGRPLEG